MERSMPGITTRQMNCSGVWSSGTAYVTFEDVKVPKTHVIGKVDKGFKYIMQNFNPERIGCVIQANRFARICIEESIVYGNKRETFGKKLVDHPVIRNKLVSLSLSECNNIKSHRLIFFFLLGQYDSKSRGNACMVRSISISKHPNGS
jgi:alkylation response protein AidB-like acyl-CoA dehydrogenase